MARVLRLAPRAFVVAGVAAAAGCGGGTGAADGDRPLEYRRGVDLAVQGTARGTEGVLRTEQFTYTSVDGARVPALFAVPDGPRPLGCLVFAPGFSSPKEAVPELRQGLARLRLATFSIDARDVGARGGAERALEAVKTPEGVRSMVLDTVTDLRIGLDWLTRRPECRSNIAVLGTSFGGTVATHLAAQDRRIRSAIITSVGATYKQTILMRPLAAERVPNLPSYVEAAAEDREVLDHAVDVLAPYDLERWIGRIAPRPVLLINGRHDPIVTPGDALQLAAAARSPKTVLLFDGGHDPFANEPANEVVAETATDFLAETLNLPDPVP